MLSDYHVHTIFSDDSEYPMEDVVKDAIAMDLEEICFTDHVDYGTKWDWDDPGGLRYHKSDDPELSVMAAANVDYPRYAAEVRHLQEKYRDQIAVKLGMEFGIQTHTIPKYRELFARYPFDFILLSIHQVEDKEFWNQAFQQGRSQDAYNRRYYEEMLAVVERYRDYSVLSHMDMIVRYDLQGAYPFEKVRPIVTEILKRVIADGKGIEVNTSSHRYGLPDLTPSREILMLYRDLGGKILTIGSDSHKPSHLGAYVRQTQRELKDMGFTQHCTFRRMEPIFYDL